MAATGGGNQADSVHSFVSCVLRRRVPAEAPSTCGHCATVGQGRLARIGGEDSMRVAAMSLLLRGRRRGWEPSASASTAAFVDDGDV